MEKTQPKTPRSVNSKTTIFQKRNENKENKLLNLLSIFQPIENVNTILTSNANENQKENNRNKELNNKFITSQNTYSNAVVSHIISKQNENDQNKDLIKQSKFPENVNTVTTSYIYKKQTKNKQNTQLNNQSITM